MKHLIPFRLNVRLLTLLLVAVACPWRSAATTFLVYKNSDDGSVGTLRYAINQNNLFVVGGGSTILFSNIVTGTSRY
jgi:hypothetical protein